MSNRNRARIQGPNGLLKLSVPLNHGRNQRRRVNEVIVSNTENWRDLHWKTLQSCYRRSPYFEFFEADMESFYIQSYDHLSDLNSASVNLLEILLNRKLVQTFTTEYVDYRYANIKEDINKNTLNIEFPYYTQVFSDRLPFMPDLSVLDLIFCIGPQESLIYLQRIHKELMSKCFHQ